MSSLARRSGVRLALVALPLAAGYLVLAGTVSAAELVAGAGAALLAGGFAAATARRARAAFRPPRRWALALAAAIPPLLAESALLAGALVRQLAGRGRVSGSDDRSPPSLRGVDAMTGAIAAAAYPGLTPNTVVRAVHRDGVTGRRLLDRRGHALKDDLARLS